jgi:hypothetical protein
VRLAVLLLLEVLGDVKLLVDPDVTVNVTGTVVFPPLVTVNVTVAV